MSAARGSNTGSRVTLTLKMQPERHLIREDGSFRHVDFHIQVKQAADVVKPERTPLTLALVLDRSGSMQGEKMQIARQAALAVLERLDERDQAAVVVFDDRIDVVQAKAAMTPATKASVRAALSLIEARANTALHEGWLTGCKAIASENAATATGLARCFLLTDGLANVGVTDPEQIASEAAGIREHAGIGTSTFGIGDDYNELLLAPMAVAGGGQFHHLRTADEIANTFIGELGDLLAVSASQVRLEIEAEPAMQVDLVSAYWANTATTAAQHSIAIGDLLNDEERHVVVRFGFPARQGKDGRVVRGRVLWVADGVEHSTAWQDLRFSYAGKEACDTEPRDPSVMHWVGLHEAARAQREAIKLNQAGNVQEARAHLKQAAATINQYAEADDEALRDSLMELEQTQNELTNAPLTPAYSKEAMYRQQNASRGQKDYRGKK
jgi:Ca-activated chloride channel family protein